MVALDIFLFTAFFLLIAVLLVCEVFLFLFLAPVGDPRTTVGYSLVGLIRNLFFAVYVLFNTVSSAISTIANNFGILLIAFTSLSALVCIAQVNTVYQADSMQVIDGKMTQVILPFYKDIVLSLADFIRIMWDSIACWYNVVASYQRVLIYNLFLIIKDCAISNWSQLTQAILDAFIGYGNATLNWIQSGFQEDFEFALITIPLGQAINIFMTPLTCACEDLFFAFNWIGSVVTDLPLHRFLQNALNALIQIIIIIFTTLFKILSLAFFTPPNYGCVYPDGCPPCVGVLCPPCAAEYLDCIANRPPVFFPVANLTCLALTNLTILIDDSLEFILQQIIGDSSSNIVPDFVVIISAPVCSIIHFAENILDLIWHVDLIFNQQVQFFLRLKTYNIINYLFAFADYVDVALTQVDTTFVSQVGCTFTNIFRALVQILDFVLVLIKVMINDFLTGQGGVTITDYIENYPYTLIKFYLEAASNCLEIAAAVISQPLADALQVLLSALAQLLDMLINLAADGGTRRKRRELMTDPEERKRDLTNTIVNIIGPKWVIFEQTMVVLAIAVGNIFRAIEINPGCVVRDPFNNATWNTFPVVTGEFCAIGNALEDGIRAIFGFLSMPVDGIIAILAGDSITFIFSQSDPTAPLNIDQHFWVAWERFVFSIAKIIPNLFAYISLPVLQNCFAGDISITSVFIEDTLRLILFFVEVFTIAWRIVGDAIAGDFSFCHDVIIPIYDASIGRVVTGFTHLLDVFVCIIANFADHSIDDTIATFSQFITTLDNFFGVGGQFPNILCDIFDVLQTVVGLIYTLFTDPGGFFAAVGNALVAVFNCIADAISNFFQQAFQVLSNFFGEFSDCFDDFFNNILPICACQAVAGPINDAFGALCSGGVCITCDGDCDIPEACNTFGSGDFGTIDWDNIKVMFDACTADINFTIPTTLRRKRQLEFENPLLAYFDRAEQYANLTLTNETMLLARLNCAHLIPFGSEDIAHSLQNNTVPTLDKGFIWGNSTGGLALRTVLRKEYHNCVMSSLSARMFDKYILMIPDPTVAIIPRHWAYDGYQTFALVWKFVGLVKYVVSYEFSKFVAFSQEDLPMFSNFSALDSNVTKSFPPYLQYMVNNGVSDDIFSVRLGWILTTMIDDVLYGGMINVSSLNMTASSGFGLVSTTLRFMRAIMGKNGLYDFFSKGSNFFRKFTDLLDNQNVRRGIRSMFDPESYTWTPRARNVIENSSLMNISNIGVIRRIHSGFERAMKDPHKVRFITAPTRYLTRIQQRIAWNQIGRPRDWRYGLFPPEVSHTHDVIDEYDIFWRHNHSKASEVHQLFFAQGDLEKRNNLANITLCINDACLNCTWLQRVIDDFIDLFYLCIQDAINNPVQIDGNLINSSTDPGNPVLPAIRPSFWGKREPVSSRWAPRPSLHLEFMNHENPWEEEQKQIIWMVAKYYADEFNQTAFLTPEMLAKRAESQNVPRPQGLAKFELFLNSGFTFLGEAFKFVNRTVSNIVGVDVFSLIQTTVGIILDRNEVNHQSGWIFWFSFFRNCDYFDNSRCNVGYQGYGLIRGFMYANLAIIIVVVILYGFSYIPVFGAISSILTSLIPFILIVYYYPTIQSLAYYSSPACAMFAPIPIFPSCIADDAWVIIRDTYAPCINWTNIGLPGLTDPKCPPAFDRCVNLTDFDKYVNISDPSPANCPPSTLFASAYERVFIDCSQAPYNFVDGFRNLFFFLKTTTPSIYDFINNSTFTPLVTFLNIPFVRKMNSFDFGKSGDPDDTWFSCQKISIPNISSLVFALGIAGALLAVGLAGLIVLLVAAWLIITGFVSLIAAFISLLTGFSADSTQVLSSSSSMNQQPPSPRPPPPSQTPVTSNNSRQRHHSTAYYDD